MYTNLNRAARIGVLTLLTIMAAPLGAQDDAQKTEGEAAPTATKPSPAVSKKTEATDSAGKKGASSGGRPSTEVFVPTEEVSVDKSISMPIDI